MKHLALFLVILCVTISCKKDSGAKFGEVDELDMKFLADGATIIEAIDHKIYRVDSEKTQYYATKPNHPAHPFLIINKLVEAEEGVFFELSGEGTGNKIETKKWFDEINLKNQKTIELYKRSKNREDL